MRIDELSRYQEQERAVVELVRRRRADAFQILEETGGDLSERGWLIYARAELERISGWPDAARRDYLAALERDPESPLALAGHTFMSVEGAERVQALARLVAEWPDLERPRLYLGLAYQHMREFEAASDAFRESLARIRQDPLAWAGLANSLLAAGDRNGAAAAAESLVGAAGNSYGLFVIGVKVLGRTGRMGRAWKEAGGASSRFGGLRARTLPWVVPLLSGSGVIRPLLIVLGIALWWVGFSLLTGLTAVPQLQIALGVPGGLLLAWVLLGAYAAGRRRQPIPRPVSTDNEIDSD